MNLHTARTLTDAALAHAESLGARVVVAVLDTGGNVVLKARMDGALLLGVQLAEDKAYTAVSVNMPSGALAEHVQPGAFLYGFNSALSGRIVPLGGGFPIEGASGELTGAIGVSGGTTEQDEEIATTAIGALA